VFINQHNGAKRASFSSLTSPIKTQAEVQLYNTLLPQHTHGSKTNWDGMARAFNDEVIMDLRSPSPTKGLLPKTSKQLAKFDRMVAQEVCRTGAMDTLLALRGAANNQPIPLAPNVQHVVNALQHLGTAADFQIMRAQAQAPAPASKPKYASKAKENKGNKQGEGKKGCRFCGWRPAEGGPTLYQHRATCKSYQDRK
jgi:hypothetical protein